MKNNSYVILLLIIFAAIAVLAITEPSDDIAPTNELVDFNAEQSDSPSSTTTESNL